MKKRIQLFLLLFLLFLKVHATDGEVAKELPVVKGYYQTINLDDNSPCNCNEKTQRMYDMTKGLRPHEVESYNIHTYAFTLGKSFLSVPKLFKALEGDPSVYKISLIEWNSMMLLTTKDFDAVSFETIAMKVFDSFSLMQPEDFLKIKNMDSYNEYIEFLKNKEKVKE